MIKSIRRRDYDLRCKNGDMIEKKTSPEVKQIQYNLKPN